ncbi:MAG: hypothetical protein JSW11_05915 [Candidatus Heimdallarchaeota archaeon]|nr:MAG: hypothetical protein JSW11_05915 [Candidatus Heimdallarchaeota archaeon]
MGSTISGVGITGYQFSQLDPFFEKKLFGLVFDYNPNAPIDQNLCLKTDLMNQTQYKNDDPDGEEDNIIALVGHNSQEIKSAFLALQQVKRTQDIIIDTIEWQTIVPFAKYLHQFTLPSGEEVILGQDFLGMALKLNGSGFNPTDYQLGYANVPLDFLEFIVPESGDSSLNLSVETSITIQETTNELQINLIYSNVTFLFQTDNIDLENIFALEFADHLIIVQFDRIEFSNIFRKYSHHGTSGVETLSEIRIGNTLNLIINEELPQDQNWTNAFDYEIQEDFRGLIPIQETFSLYQGSDIKNRLQQFSDISFSIITAQNIGVLNGTQAVDNFRVLIDDQNRTSREIDRNSYPVKEEITVLHDEQLLFSTQVKGRNFAQQDDILSLVPIETQVIALDQQSGFAENLLFLQETSLLKELVAECVKRFISNPTVSTLGTNEIINKGGLDLMSALYYQDFQLKGWTGSGFKINLIQYAVKTRSSSSINTKLSQLTLSPTVSELLGFLILGVIIIRRMRTKRKRKNL